MLHQKARKHGFDIEHYNQLRREQAEVEHDLRRLRDPLFFRYANASTQGPARVGFDSTKIPGVPLQELPLNPRSKIASIIDTAAKKLKK